MFAFQHERPEKPENLKIYEAHVGMGTVEPKVSTYVEFAEPLGSHGNGMVSHGFGGFSCYFGWFGVGFPRFSSVSASVRGGFWVLDVLLPRLE